MDEPTEVYVVTKGLYSEYSISNVFIDKTMADEWAERNNAIRRRSGELSCDEFRVETHPVCKTLQEIPALFGVTIDASGNEVHREADVDDVDEDRDDRVGINRDASGKIRGIRAESMRGYDVALKAARDKLAEAKAREAGVA